MALDPVVKKIDELSYRLKSKKDGYDGKVPSQQDPSQQVATKKVLTFVAGLAKSAKHTAENFTGSQRITDKTQCIVQIEEALLQLKDAINNKTLLEADILAYYRAVEKEMHSLRNLVKNAIQKVDKWEQFSSGKTEMNFSGDWTRVKPKYYTLDESNRLTVNELSGTAQTFINSVIEIDASIDNFKANDTKLKEAEGILIAMSDIQSLAYALSGRIAGSLGTYDNELSEINEEIKRNTRTLTIITAPTPEFAAKQAELESRRDLLIAKIAEFKIQIGELQGLQAEAKKCGETLSCENDGLAVAKNKTIPESKSRYESIKNRYEVTEQELSNSEGKHRSSSGPGRQ